MNEQKKVILNEKLTEMLNKGQVENEEPCFYHASNRCSPERMEMLFKSLRKIEDQINADYIRRKEELEKELDEKGERVIIPTYRHMLGNEKISITVDMEMIDYIENLIYIEHIYEHNFPGKVVRLKVGIQEGE